MRQTEDINQTRKDKHLNWDERVNRLILSCGIVLASLALQVAGDGAFDGDPDGRIMDQLKTLGLLENTLVIFTADNGGLTWKEVTSNYPLMGGKSFSHEGAYRVPFIANWKGRIEPGQINDTRVVGTDLYPTILQAATLPSNPKQHVDGLSLMGEFTKGQEADVKSGRSTAGPDSKNDLKEINLWKSGR